MRFIFRSVVLLLIGTVVMGLLRGSRLGRSGGFLSSLSSSPSTVFEHIRNAVPAEAAGLLPEAVHAGSSGEAIYFSPTDNLERVDVALIREARSSIEVAMYAFADKTIAEALARQASAGVAVYVYRDRD